MQVIWHFTPAYLDPVRHRLHADRVRFVRGRFSWTVWAESALRDSFFCRFFLFGLKIGIVISRIRIYFWSLDSFDSVLAECVSARSSLILARWCMHRNQVRNKYTDRPATYASQNSFKIRIQCNKDHTKWCMVRKVMLVSAYTLASITVQHSTHNKSRAKHSIDQTYHQKRNHWNKQQGNLTCMCEDLHIHMHHQSYPHASRVNTYVPYLSCLKTS
jgi:hypothetical protein